ncbi:MAG: DUF5329 domain-containing protein [Burkholderiales bacterium]
MKARQTLLVSSLLWACSVQVAFAQPPAGVRTEVDGLLRAVEQSACEFGRNGTWHDSKAAEAHMRDKYDYLVARDLIRTSEDFIERVGTKSSLSGQAYQVRCKGVAPLASNHWLQGMLARLRSPATSAVPGTKTR